ncbi:MAG: cytochrome c oxidase assembly protein [Gammaproteobacteria bacterium]
MPVRRTATRLAIAAVAMFGFGYALVPLYNVFCNVAGINGTTGNISQAKAEQSQVDSSRWITVEFDANVGGALPWEFRPLTRKIKVHPGEIGEALFFAENRSNRVVTARAVPSVAPAQAAIHFKKTQCFCFTQQTLDPGEQREMPVKFIVDTDLPDRVGAMTLSYTFFEAPASVSARENAARESGS